MDTSYVASTCRPGYYSRWTIVRKGRIISPSSTWIRPVSGCGPMHHRISTNALTMEKVLLITNALYLDLRNREGGVRNCTNEFIELLSTRFQVITFPVTNHISIAYR